MLKRKETWLQLSVQTTKSLAICLSKRSVQDSTAPEELESDDNDDDDETPTGEQHGPQVLPEPINLRRSQRERRQPNRYGYP